MPPKGARKPNPAADLPIPVFQSMGFAGRTSRTARKNSSSTESASREENRPMPSGSSALNVRLVQLNGMIRAVRGAGWTRGERRC